MYFGNAESISYLFYENYYTMATLVGIFFSFISVLGLLKGKSKKFIRKVVLIVFSLFLILGQVLFMNSILTIESQEFIAISGLLSGIILILAFQKNEAW
jgi:asparagine N-glycosylation enzyme membrane subunit Stt3